MVAMGMGRYHRDGLRSDFGHNLVQIGYVRPRIYQKRTLITLYNVE